MAKNRIGFSSDFVLLNNRVGIGTTNPNATLDVKGDINISGIVTITDFVALNAVGGASTQQIRVVPYTSDSGIISFEGDAGQLFSISNTNTGTLFAVNNTLGVPILSVVDTDGAVGLGTTAVGTVRVGLGTTSTPTVNSSMSFELTSNTNLRFKVRGTDGVLRSGNITLA